MATISFRDFSQGQPVKTIGDEGKVQTQEQNGGQKLFSQLAERAKTFGKEAVTLGTLGASTMTPQDFNATGQDRSLAALQGLNRAGQSPIRMAGAVGGAIGDVVGAGLEATGLDKPIGQVLAPIAESQPVQKAMEVFKSLPQETQEVLGAIVNTANIPISGAGLGVAKTGIQKAGQVATETVAPLAKKVLPKLTPDAEQIMQRVARVSKGKQANFEARAGESIGAYLDKRGIYGDVDQITEQLYNRFQQSKGTADEALASLQGNYQPTAVRTALAELEKKLTRVSSEGAVDPNLGKVSGLLAKFDNQGLTMSEINEAKRLYERNVKLDFLRENNPEGITTANNIDNAIRSWQFNQAEKLGLKNLPEINKETMLAKQLLDDLGKEYAGSAGNNMITLTDWIVLSGGDPTAVAGFLTKQGLSSKKVQSFIAKLISKNQPKKGQVTPQTGEATVLPIGTYKDFLKETSKTSKPTTQPQVKKGLSPQPNSTTKEGVVNELINNPLRGSVTPSEFLPKKKVGSESTSLYHGTENTDITNFIPSKTGDLGSGVYLTRDKNTALRFSDPSFRNSSLEPKGNGEYVNINTGETYKPPKPGVIDINGSNLKIYKIKPGEIQDEISKLRDPKTKVLPVGYENMVQQKFKKMGYDGIEVTGTPRGENDQVLIFPESVNKLKINKSISPLEQEAKKYKSAEEFVKAKTNAYHGSYTSIDKFEKGYFGDTTANNEAEVFYFTKSPNHATEYSREAFARRFEGEYGEKMGYSDEMMKKLYEDAGANIQINPSFVDIQKPKVINWKGESLAGKWEDAYEMIRNAKSKGYDGVIFKNISDDVNPESLAPQDVVIAFEPEQIMTKSQLTDIWKKANKK